VSDTLEHPPLPESTPPPRGMSIAERAVAVFVRPADAWSGLEHRAQWWFPFTLMMLVTSAWSALLFPRAILPMVLDELERKVADGRASPEQLAMTERMMSGAAGLAFTVIPQALIQVIMVLILAALLSFVVSFILGTRLTFRPALEVTCWSWMVHIPNYIATGALAWVKESMLGVHVGFGALLPEPDVMSRLQYGLANALDAFGPLALWPVVVAILGVSALSGAPRRSVAWLLGVTYAVLAIVFAAFGALNAPVG
jgi:hypothetical protein